MSNSKIKNFNLLLEIEAGPPSLFRIVFRSNDSSLNSNLPKYRLHRRVILKTHYIVKQLYITIIIICIQLFNIFLYLY